MQCRNTCSGSQQRSIRLVSRKSVADSLRNQLPSILVALALPTSKSIMWAGDPKKLPVEEQRSFGRLDALSSPLLEKLRDAVAQLDTDGMENIPGRVQLLYGALLGL